jgi:methionyl-tRNA formyltransferase
MRIGLLSSSPVVLGAMSFLYETGNLAGVAVPSTKVDFIDQLETYSSQYQFKFNPIELSNLEVSLLDWLQEIEPDVVFVYMFSQKIPASILSIPKKFGFINFHGGKLPEYRGPVPDYWMIRNGESQGALTAHIMEPDYDSGPILVEIKVNISENETSGSLISKLGLAAGYCMERTIEELEKGNKGIPQDINQADFYRRPEGNQLYADFINMEAVELHALVRAANLRYKGAFSKIRTRPVRILQTTLLSQNEQLQVKPGVLFIDRNFKEVWIGCASNTSLRIDVVELFEGTFSGYRFAEYIGLRDGEII